MPNPVLLAEQENHGDEPQRICMYKVRDMSGSHARPLMEAGSRLMPVLGELAPPVHPECDDGSCHSLRQTSASALPLEGKIIYEPLCFFLPLFCHHPPPPHVPLESLPLCSSGPPIRNHPTSPPLHSLLLSSPPCVKTPLPF